MGITGAAPKGASVRTLLRSSPHFILPVLFGLGIGVLFLAAVVGRQRRRLGEDRDAALEVAQAVGVSLRRQVELSMSAVVVMASLARVAGEEVMDRSGGRATCKQEEFAWVAADMMDNMAVASFELAPGGIVTCVHPLEGNEEAIGFDVMNGGGGAEAVRNRDQVTVRGPLQLAQGGMAVVAHLAVFRGANTSAPGAESFWGIVTAVLGLDTLAKESQIEQLPRHGYKFHLLANVAETGQQIALIGDRSEPDDPVRVGIVMHNGRLRWVLEVWPAGGWDHYEGLLAADITGFVAIMGMQTLGVFLLYRAAAERQLMRESVRVVTRVSEQLVQYDTAEARRVLHGAVGVLRHELLRALNILLSNLDEYRPYLPDALLVMQEEISLAAAGCSNPLDSSAQHIGSPIGAPTATTLCVCFTDIQSSTVLWEAFPQGMYDALRMHNTLLRKQLADASGYEVKTIGDAFMAVFESARDGLVFALSAQEALVVQRWPDDLVLHPLCMLEEDRVTGRAVWHGLRVRIGLQYGEVRPEQNPVTLRYDYFGPTVNEAARVEAAVRFGGLVGATAAALAAAGPGLLGAADGPIVLDVGPVELKGVAHPVHLSILIPRSLGAQRGRAQAAAHALAPSRFAPAEDDRVTEVSTRSAGSLCLGNEESRLSTEGGAAPANLSEISPHGVSAQKLTSRWSRSEVATVAHAALSLSDVDSVSEALLMFLALCSQTADTTRGVLVSVLSAYCVAVWNGVTRCPVHTVQCEHFLYVVYRSELDALHVGAATGGVVSGTVPAGRHRHATVYGGCVELAAALAEDASSHDDRALVAGAIAEYAASVHRAFCTAVWDVPGWDQPLTVFVLAPAQVGGDGEERWGNLADDCYEMSAVEMGGPGGWEDHFVAACRKDAAAGVALAKAAAEAPGDTRLAHVSALAEAGKLRCRRVPELPGVAPGSVPCRIVTQSAPPTPSSVPTGEPLCVPHLPIGWE